MTLLKTLHVTCAYATGLGFLLRGILSMTGNPLLQHRIVRTLPHLVDTVLLCSAIALLYIWSLTPYSTPWLGAKIIALMLYIAFGFTLLRFGKTAARRGVGFFGGMLTYVYIVWVAHTKNPWPWSTFFAA